VGKFWGSGEGAGGGLNFTLSDLQGDLERVGEKLEFCPSRRGSEVGTERRLVLTEYHNLAGMSRESKQRESSEKGSMERAREGSCLLDSASKLANARG